LQSRAGKASQNQPWGYGSNPNRGYNQQSTPLANYQRNTGTPSYGTQVPQSPYQRTASPLNAGNVSMQYGVSSRQSFGTPISSTQTRSQYLPPATPNSQQQAAIDRQRAELAAQTTARLNAATAGGAMSPGSPI
jgi:hypothetical protein